jgi:heme oxygenase (biliverdin-IX-beta and delta-forming)
MFVGYRTDGAMCGLYRAGGDLVSRDVMISAAHQRLRDATQADHQRLESRLDILARIASPTGRRALVQDFHCLHREAEAALEPWLGEMPGLEFDARRRSVQLSRDLQAVGGQARAASAPPKVANAQAALGRMYVLEGSTLGGRVIRKAVSSRGDHMGGLSFLDPYGERVSERWRSFLAVVAAQVCGPTQIEALIAGALAGFRHAEARLCGETADV